MQTACNKRSSKRKTQTRHTGLLDDHRAVEPPESIPNSEVKRSIADGSVGLPHVRVGHRQALILKARLDSQSGFFLPERKCFNGYPVGL